MDVLFTHRFRAVRTVIEVVVTERILAFVTAV